MKKINIAIVEDHQLVRQGMVSLLKEEEGLNVLFDVGDGQQLLDMLKTAKPDIILLDIQMPVMDGKEALHRMRELYPKIKVIIISMHFNDVHITEMISKGAAGFLPKNCDIEKVVDAIYSVYDNGYYFDTKVSRSLVEELMRSANVNPFPDEYTLSYREIEILKLVCLEKNNNEISEAVCLSKRTVEWHKKNILLKTGSKTLVGLVKYAIKHKIINDPENF